MSIRRRINALIESKKSYLCVGLDADLKKIPKFFHKEKYPMTAFNLAVIEATADYAVAYKPNLAFYEAHGIYGLEQLQQTLEAVPKNCITIADAKRADIGNTSAMYAQAFFETWNFDCVTVPPYMGFDSLEPFFAYKEKLTFVLALTSNSGSKDFEEEYLLYGRKLYESVVKKAVLWNEHDNIGLVVGATKPEELQEIRHAAPEMCILIPGVGAQGGSVSDAVRYGTDRHRGSALVNVGRALIYPEGKFETVAAFQQNVAAETKAIAAEMQPYLKRGKPTDSR
jgi:orotidine-5'-phosphate decarboxylase